MVCRLRSVHGTSGEKAPIDSSTPTRSNENACGNPPDAVACFETCLETCLENKLRIISTKQYPPIAAKRIPPSGRSKMQAPIERPHPSQIVNCVDENFLLPL